MFGTRTRSREAAYRSHSMRHQRRLARSELRALWLVAGANGVATGEDRRAERSCTFHAGIPGDCGRGVGTSFIDCPTLISSSAGRSASQARMESGKVCCMALLFVECLLTHEERGRKLNSEGQNSFQTEVVELACEATQTGCGSSVQVAKTRWGGPR